MNRTVCALCLDADSAIRDSHILPSWSFKRLRGDGKCPHPGRVENGLAMQTAKQLREYLLCDNCEARMKRAEDYLHAVSAQRDGEFPAAERLGGEFASGRGLSARAPGEMDPSLLAYFATSVIWRADVSSVVPRVTLDPYSDAFRRYLLGESGLPGEAVVLCLALDPSEPKATDYGLFMTAPITERFRMYDCHRFFFFGFQFQLFVGPRLPDALQEYCLARGARPAIMVGGPRNTGFVAATEAKIAAARVVGALAKLVVPSSEKGAG